MSTAAWLAIAAVVAIALYLFLRPSAAVSALPDSIAEDTPSGATSDKASGRFSFSLGF